MERREFLIGCSAAIAAMAGSRITGFSFDPSGESANEIFVYIFLRGGCDGLNLVAPVNDRNYVVERPVDLRITDANDNQGLTLQNGLASALDFRIHKSANELKELYDANKLAIIHAAGLTNGTRSHFDAMDIIERGSLDDKNLTEGWFTRYLATSGSVTSSTVYPSIAINSTIPASFLGSTSTLAIGNLAEYKLRADPRMNTLLKNFYKGKSSLDEAAQDALLSIEAINQRIAKDDTGKAIPYAPSNNASYPNNAFGKSMQTLAQVIKMDVGLQIASVDYGGWDTHERQQNVFSTLTEGLSKSLGAFYNDIAAYESIITILVMSEFGRRLKANKSNGTDHGHGNVMFALGGNVNGGRMYGQWPGLENEQLDNQVDLAVTTDYRNVLSEIVVKRLSNPKLGYIFPGFKKYKPLGFMKGNNLAIDYSSALKETPTVRKTK